MTVRSLDLQSVFLLALALLPTIGVPLTSAARAENLITDAGAKALAAELPASPALETLLLQGACRVTVAR